MAEVEEERPPLLTDEGGEQRLCPISHLGFQKGDQSYTVNLVPIALNEGCLLVAAPEEAWSRVVAERLLPKRALTRAILAEVAVVRQEDRVTVLDSEEGMKLWVGFLDKAHTRRVVAGEGGEVDADIVKDAASEEPLYPFSQSLLEIAAEHFAFLTAESGPPVGVVGRKKDDVDQRLDGIEQTMKQVQDALAEVLRGRDVPGAKSGSFSIGAQPKRKSALRRPPAVPAGLDPGVVSSARAAGIPEEQIQQFGQLLSKPTKMTDAPGLKEKSKDLSESSDTEEDGAEAAEGEREGEESKEALEAAALDPVGKAVVHLTKIVGNLSKPKKMRREIEELLDGVDAGLDSTSASSSTSKSKAAVYQKLRKSLVHEPTYVYRQIEQLMEEDFVQMRAAPGSSGQNFSSRAWLEHRSRLGFYPQTIRMGWILCGIHDCLKNGRQQEARARAAAAIMALDQASLDSGNWLMAQECLLEDGPPMTSFQGRRQPEQWEQPTSHLLDDRWVSVLTWKLKEKDSYLEARRRLGQGKGSRDGKGDTAVVEDPKISKWQKKGKDGKGERKGDKTPRKTET